MSIDFEEVLTCPKCAHSIATNKTVGKDGSVLLTCPACKTPTRLSLFRSPVDQPKQKTRSQRQEGAVSFFAVGVGSVCLLIGLFFILAAAAGFSSGSSIRSQANFQDLSRQLATITVLLQLLIGGKLIGWSMNILKKATE